MKNYFLIGFMSCLLWSCSTQPIQKWKIQTIDNKVLISHSIPHHFDGKWLFVDPDGKEKSIDSKKIKMIDKLKPKGAPKK